MRQDHLRFSIGLHRPCKNSVLLQHHLTADKKSKRSFSLSEILNLIHYIRACTKT